MSGDPKVNAPSDEVGDDELVVGGEVDAELDASPGDPFFVSKNAAAVLKHGILNRYIVPFASKAGSTSEGKRVVVLDGYAGPGRYDDGTEGSPALLARSARTVAGFRNVECHFVEQRFKSFYALRDYLAVEGADLAHFEYRGSVQNHLPAIVSHAEGAPLFAYLDPFGFGVPFEDVVWLLRRYTGRYEPGTEVLLNFTANGIRRVGALLRRPLSPSETKTVERADVACGGTWWRDEFLKHEQLDDSVWAVTRGYRDRVCAAARVSGFAVPVRNRTHHKPVYSLLFFTRHRDGLWLFNQAVSKAGEEWRAACAAPPGVLGGDTLFELEDPLIIEERANTVRWIETIEGNILALLKEGSFVVQTKMTEVYGDVIGEAREMHVKAAIKKLHKAGLTPTTGVGDIPDMRVEPNDLL